MHISTKGRYALRALLEMAENQSDKPILLSFIADRQDIPERYLIQIFSSLRKAGLVRSFRGAKGGFQLAKPAQAITLADIVEAAEGPMEILDCLRAQNTECARLDFCYARNIWLEVNEKIKAVFQGATLAEMVQKQRVHRLQGRGNYQI
ncbi:Rrf2 family transcriptional regulator [candidate division FCPU426 bacterium]|nr:Rrf2 family transcriptional regulator [candidate division FCPU426 bacterium]